MSVANSVYLEAEFLHKGKKFTVKLSHSSISIKKIPFNPKDGTVVLRFTDIVGIEAHPQQKNTLVLYTYEKTGKNRERRVYAFQAQENEIVKEWVRSTRCLLRGVEPDKEQPPKQRIVVFVNPAGGKGKAFDIWNNVSDMFEVANIDTTVYCKYIYIFI